MMDKSLAIFIFLLTWKYQVSLLLGLLFLCNVNCFEYKTCDNIKSFAQYDNKPLNLCADECSRRQRCQVFMFRKQRNYCALKEEVNVTSLQDGDPYCVYYTRDEWSPDDIGSCRGQPCDATERCNSKTKTEFECIRSECPSPIQILNAHSLSNVYAIGSTNRYKCSTGTKGRGNPTITCLENATWSITDFKCVLQLPNMVCPTPKVSYVNAELSELTGSGDVGTTLTYTCKNGFRGNGEEQSITCTSSEEWNIDRINCCHDNSTHFLRQQCIAFVDGGIVNSRTEAKDYCTELGGWVTWVYYEWDSTFDTSKTQTILQSTTMTHLHESDWFDKCAAANNFTPDQSLTLQEKIDKIRTEDLSGDGCTWGNNWIEGQPDYIPSEECIFRNMSDTGKRHYDDECSFPSNVGFVCRFSTPKVSN
ncbi:Sushi [Mactra antiquata]